MGALIFAAAMLLTAAPQAMPGMDPAPAACPATPAPLPAELTGWDRPSPVRGGAGAQRATALQIGQAVVATLLATPDVTYAVSPGKPGGPDSYGGVFGFSVPTGGRYRVALGGGAWIDMLSGATPVASVAHGHGPQCTGIAKTVDFDLEPGSYLLQIAGAGPTTLRMMVLRLPSP